MCKLNLLKIVLQDVPIPLAIIKLSQETMKSERFDRFPIYTKKGIGGQTEARKSPGNEVARASTTIGSHGPFDFLRYSL